MMGILKAIRTWIANTIYKIYEYWINPPTDTDEKE